MLETLANTLICLEKCTSLKTLKQAHARVFLKGLHHENYLAVKLVSFCSKALGNVDYARMIFDSLVRSANVFLWTTMITCYTNHQSEATKEEAILLFKTMHQHGPHPNNFTLSSVLKACSSLRAIWEGSQINSHATKLGFGSYVYVQTTLLDMYAKFGWIQEAGLLFGIMSKKNVVAYNAMIACYAKACDMEAARGVFDKMSQKDLISWTVMISGYSGNGNMLAARNVFDQMPEREINSWNALIAGYSHTGDSRECIVLFNDMQLGCVRPDHVTMAVLMSACGHLGSLKIASQFHGLLRKYCIDVNVYVFNSLVDMYAKCGSIHEACKIFSEIPVKDVVSYNVLIAGFANHGLGKDAVILFPELLEGGLRPDTVTFLGILTACSQSGLVDVGRRYFDCMSRDYAVEPSVDHYACMVDLYGRAGFVEEAYELVRTMSVVPHAGVWGALLNACRTYCDVEVGEIAARELFKIEPGNPGNYVLMSNIYARARVWDGVSEVRHLMRGRRVAKTTGCSWIEVDCGIEEFLMGDATHRLREEISAVLRHLSLQLQENGLWGHFPTMV